VRVLSTGEQSNQNNINIVEIKGIHRTPSDEASMKANKTSSVMCGHDQHLLATRQWVLQSRGYRVLTVAHPSKFASIPQNPPIKLLILCHSLSPEECDGATALATARWPEIQSLVLDSDGTRIPAGLLGQLLHTLEGPAKLISVVSQIVGNGRQATESPRP
jgi:hypothetical protein